LQAQESGASAAELVVTEAPPDDAGARTADLYEWQAVMAAADGLRLHLDGLDADGQLISRSTITFPLADQLLQISRTQMCPIDGCSGACCECLAILIRPRFTHRKQR
jgi:hypothetical protein